MTENPSLTPAAQAVVDHLTAPDAEPDATLALVVPYGISAAERATLLDHATTVVQELRHAGWPVEVTVARAPNGEVHALSLPTAA